MRASSPKYAVLHQIPAANIVTGTSYNVNVNTNPVPAGQMVRRVFARVRTDLTNTSSASAKIQIGEALTRRSLFNALISAIVITAPGAVGAAGGPQVCQSMGLGDLVDGYRELGIQPTSPELFGAEGTFYAPITPQPRSILTPAPGTSAHFATIEIPLIDGRIPGAGSALYLGGEQLGGLNIQITFGSFSFSDSVLNTITIPPGTGTSVATIGCTYIDIVAEYEPTPDGRTRFAVPVHFEKLPNGTTPDVTLNPQGGAVLCSKVTLDSSVGTNLSDIMRANVFSTAGDLSETAEAAWNPQLKVDGQTPSDLPFRGLQFFAGIDRMNAGLVGRSVDPNALRYQNASTIGQEPPSGLADYGVTLLWVAPSKNLFDTLTLGKVDVSFPNQWVALGNRTIYQSVLYPVPGSDRAVPAAALSAAKQAPDSKRAGFWARVQQFLGVRQ